MPRTIVPGRAKLDIYKPENDDLTGRTPDISIGPGATPAADTAEHIKKASIPRTLGAVKDQASFAVDNRGGRYARGAQAITSGDEVVFSVEFAEIGAGSGATGYGAGYGANYGGRAGWDERFRGVVRNPKISGDGAGASILSFKCEEFVGAVLGWRYLEAGYKNRRIAGSPDAILERALAEKCPEIARDRITADAKTSTREYNATKMLKVVGDLAARADSVVSSEGRSLVFRPLSGITSAWTLDADDFGAFDLETDDGELANAVRIDGGHSEGITDAQRTRTGWRTVTESTRLTRQLDVPKAEVSSIEVWTDPTRTASGDGVVVRLQTDDGNGAPVGIEDPSLDLPRKTLAEEFLEHGGFTRFLLPDNNVLDDDPWLIIEGDGAGDGSGQDIAVNNAGVPAHVVYYPFPVSARDSDADSIAEYRRRELQISDSSLSSLEALGAELHTQLDRENSLSHELGFEARSTRAHLLAPGDAIAVDMPTAGLAGEMVVTKRDEVYDGAQLKTDITTADIESL